MEGSETPQNLSEVLHDGYINIIDRSPEHPKTDVPVFISPGWSENPTVFEDTIQEFLNAGRRVIALSYSGTRESNKETNYPNLEVSKGEAILEVIKLKGIKQADVVGHSEGAIGAVIAASLEPDSIRNMILVAPSGFIGKDTFPKLLGRFSRKIIQDHYRLLTDRQSRKPMARFLKQGFRFAVSHPLQGFREAVAISQVQLQDTLKELHNLGVGTAIIAGVDDPVFRMNRLQRTVKSNMLDGFISTRGGHDEIHLQNNYAKAAESMLTSLENREPRH